jgi:antitoxin VapB
MPLSVNHPEANELAHTLAERMGETVDDAVVTALRERLARTPERTRSDHRPGELLAIGGNARPCPTTTCGAPKRFWDTTKMGFLAEADGN